MNMKFVDLQVNGLSLNENIIAWTYKTHKLHEILKFVSRKMMDITVTELDRNHRSNQNQYNRT